MQGRVRLSLRRRCSVQRCRLRGRGGKGIEYGLVGERGYGLGAERRRSVWEERGWGSEGVVVIVQGGNGYGFGEKGHAFSVSLKRGLNGISTEMADPSPDLVICRDFLRPRDDRRCFTDKITVTGSNICPPRCEEVAFWQVSCRASVLNHQGPLIMRLHMCSQLLSIHSQSTAVVGSTSGI